MENEYQEEQTRKALLPKLFRLYKTLNKMMEDRGYTVEKEYEEMTFKDWALKYGEKNTINKIYSKKKDENDENKENNENIDNNENKEKKQDSVKRLYFEFIEGAKISAKDILNFTNKMEEGKAESGIIVISGELTSQAKQKLVETNNILHVDFFKISELMVNITEHSYVPKHILLNDEEKNILLKRYKIKENQLPKILTSDPVAKYLGLRKGNVVKIIRDSETAGKYVTYRITAAS